jgi:trimeric autotransporter adhesin
MSCVRALNFFPTTSSSQRLAVEMDGSMAMVRKSSLFAQLLAALPLVGAGFLSLGSTVSAVAQATPRITSQVENSALVSLPNSVHPWARAQFDRGPAPANMNGRMLMVLKRSPEQEADLQTLLAQQQDPHSPNYHKWLTPEDFGKRFGVADADLQTVNGYLSAQGMNVGRIYGNHMAIEVTATPAQIKSTFQTEIHAYSVGGKTFYANNSDPKIPSALHSVVSGFASLNNFHAAGGSGAGTQATLDAATHTLKPLYTTGTTNNLTYGVSPADLGVIYDIPASSSTTLGRGGSNTNVGVVGDSDINVSYVNNYRSIFGLTANPPVVVVDGNDPGVNDDAYIAYKQIELVGAVAPNATIYYYTSATTDYDTGLNFALIRAVTDNQVQVLVIGFQSCETAIGAAGLYLVNQVTEEAAAQGMTIVAASGNSGSAACEVPGTAGSATTGLAINGYAASPYVTAVGGTDFFYGTGNITTYWSNANSGTPNFTSARSYIPEQVWNDSYVPGGTGTSNSANGVSVELASGGGPSRAGVDGVSTPEPIPSYQTGKINGISTTSRVIPDISFFAGSGSNNTEGYNKTAYLFCMQPSDCQPGGTLGSVQFTYSGGTEASSAVFAGAVALAVNKLSTGLATPTPYGLGNINPGLYSLMGTKIAPHDITRGTNELACTGTNSCAGGHMTSYAAGTGFDAATGFGSFDITSFVTYYAPLGGTSSTVSLTIIDPATGKAPMCGTTPNCTTHSTMLKFTVTAKSTSGTGAAPTGDVDIFTSSPLQADSTVGALTLSAGTATATANQLPGGTYNIYARYAGDNTYASTVAAATPATITVMPEACQMVVYGHNINMGTTTNVPYGTPITITVEPYSAASTVNNGIPSGSINVIDNGVTITTLPINSEGAATFTSNLLPVSGIQHQIVLSYAGDASFTPCQTPQATPFLANVIKAPTTLTLSPPNPNTTQGNITLTATVQSATLPSHGTAPTGSIVFGTTSPQTVALVPGFDVNGNAMASASLTITPSSVPANGKITATYAGDSNYVNSSATATVSSSSALFGSIPSTTSISVSDTNGVTDCTTNCTFSAQDSLTLNIHVASSNDPAGCANFIIFGCNTEPTVSVLANGTVLTNSISVDDNGNATFTLPQQNGYLALPSGQVELNVIYTGYTINVFFFGIEQIAGSSAVQTITINDDRTSADFSLQTSTTVNQTAPLKSPVAQATYNLRLTSLYNFNSPPFSTTPIALTCKVVGYTLARASHAVPAGMTCGFGSLSTTTTNVTLGTSGFATSTLVVGAASGFSIASNATPAQPNTRWWVAGGGTTLACIFLLGLPARRRKWQSLLGACVLVIVGFGMTGCGASVAAGPNQSYYDGLNGGSAGSQAGGGTPVTGGTYTVLVTATTTTNGSAPLIHTLPVQVLVGTTF